MSGRGRSITIERNCYAQLLAEAARLVGDQQAGWLSFQPLDDWIVSIQPDLLEE